MNYKDTLNLPQTDFPMRAGLVDSEPARLEQWEGRQLYKAIQSKRKDSSSPRFILHDGPPFANGNVHMGTALNKLLKDLVLKSKSMAGFETPYVPGWDCHGLPIEFKVVEQAQGLEPAEIRRRCEKFARKFIDTQRVSFRRLGVFGDWDNPYLTLDPAYEADIIRVFAAIAEKGLVYASKKPVQWSYGAQTALAEAEVDYKEITDPAVFVKFPVTSGLLAQESSLVIWTTTPWTLPANLALALHERLDYTRGNFVAEDGRSEDLVIATALVDAFCEKTGFRVKGETRTFKGREFSGAYARHPFLDRESKIILADFVTTETGTGIVHVAPGHGGDDYLAGMANGLEILSPVDDEGNYTAEAGLPDLTGRHVLKCNEDIIKLLEESNTLMGREDYSHSYPHCWRSKTPIIFRAVPQFFIKIDEFRQEALAEIDKVQWLPAKNQNRIRGTVEARPDWCISRQRTWGVPLPVFHDTEGKPIIDASLARKVADLVESGGSNLWFEKDDQWWTEQLDLPTGTTRCRDTLDVWIDSGSSHVAVTDRHPELTNPADLYLEATDQHRGWFQSSLMLSMVVRNSSPYRAVMTHGFVVDQDTGKKVSKSDQSSNDEKAKKKKKVKPTEADHFVSKFGADILRLWVASVDWENEVPFGEGLFKQTSETYRRIRNTLRILIGNLSDCDHNSTEIEIDTLTLIDRWILERLNVVTHECLDGYEKFQFRKVYNSLNSFCTNDLSSIYIDITKDRMYCDQAHSSRRRATQFVMRKVFDSLCQLLAPILCFTADEAWEYAGHKAGDIHTCTFPEPDPDFSGTDATEKINTLMAYRNIIQQAIEPLRQEKIIRANEEASVDLTLPEGAATPLELLAEKNAVNEFFIISDLNVFQGGTEPIATARKSDHGKCPRCWRLFPEVTGDDTLCQRCSSAVS
ncbi:MAG: isoleucine--tRNA ligase [Verrucomicrobiales bacterium]|nr:isoleucine--tRNA ligase [Verrucomicrobiales bacterium]